MSDQEYFKDLAILIRDAPSHPYLEVLKEGASSANKMRIAYAFETIDEYRIVETKKPIVVKSQPNDAVLSQLIGKRAKLANEMHNTCEKRGLTKRKRINDDILDINEQIKIHLGYKVKTPEVAKEPKPLHLEDKSKSELIIMRGRISAAICRQKKLISQNENDKRGEKLKNKLTQLETSYVEIQRTIQATV